MASLKFYESLKAILFDVESFLNGTLESVKLNQRATNEKDSILSKLRQLQDEYPQLKSAPALPEPRVVSTPSFGRAGKVAPPVKPVVTAPEEDDDDGEIYSDVDPSCIAPDITRASLSPSAASFTGTLKSTTASISGESEASDTQSVTTPTSTMSALEITSDSAMTGFLVRRNVGKMDIKSMMMGLKSAVLGKMYCVASGGVLYMYDKLNSKKPTDSIVLFGYEARQSSTEQTSKKDLSFELVCPGQKSYGFSAGMEEEMKKWVIVLNEESLKQPEIRQAAAAAVKSKSSSSAASLAAAAAEEEEECDEMYEDTEVIGQMVAQHRKPDKPVPEAPPSDDEGEIYADIGPTDPPPPTIPSTPHPVPVHSGNRVTVTQDDFYDDATTGAIQFSGAEPSNQQPSADDESQDDDDDDDDYGSKYYGKWDCKSESGNEISFTCGEMVKVLSKEYDRFGWWVGRANGLIGLVPRDYLTPAYQLVN